MYKPRYYIGTRSGYVTVWDSMEDKFHNVARDTMDVYFSFIDIKSHAGDFRILAKDALFDGDDEHFDLYDFLEFLTQHDIAIPVSSDVDMSRFFVVLGNQIFNVEGLKSIGRLHMSASLEVYDYLLDNTGRICSFDDYNTRIFISGRQALLRLKKELYFNYITLFFNESCTVTVDCDGMSRGDSKISLNYKDGCNIKVEFINTNGVVPVVD